MTPQQFIEKIAPLVQKYASQYNIKVCSPVIAQAVLESASGTSELAVNAHNYFGLKYRAGRCPSACGIYYKIGSEQNPDGSYTSSAMQWMKFSDMDKGVKGYFDFINISNYKSVKGVTDPKTYLENIKKAGYATSIKYVDNLLAVIAKYNLTQYDPPTKDNQNNKEENNMSYKVAIDAGHGSKTAGKRTPDNYLEHWINVKTAYYCEQFLKQHGIETVRIGWDDTNSTDDVDVALSTRQNQIKNAKCDYSISLHANAHTSVWSSASGVETLIHNNSAYVKDSLALANKVQARIVKGTSQKNRGVKKQSLAMCNCVAMGVKAACLVEIGFMTNKAEAKLMKTDAFCKEQGEDVAKGFLDYVGITVKTDVSTPTVSSPTVTVSKDTYVVQKRDTLSKIGTKTGVAWKTIAELNGIKFPYVINVGQVLKLKNTTTKPITSTATTSNGKYVYKGLDYSLVFNPTYYTNSYSDLKRHFGTDATKLFNHFCQYGMAEGRRASANFSPTVYKNRYPDLQQAFGNDMGAYYRHYIMYGHQEKRRAT